MQRQGISGFSRTRVKVPITAVADLDVFTEKIKLDTLCELSALQMIHMKCQTLVSLKNSFKKIKMSSITKTCLFKYTETFTTKKMKIFR